MRIRYLVAAAACAVSLTACGGSPTQIGNALRTIGKEAAMLAAENATQEVIENALAPTGMPATEAAYQQYVDQRLTAATTYTLCAWLGGAIVNAQQFRASLVNNLSQVAQQHRIPPHESWMGPYIAAAEGLAQQIIDSGDPNADYNTAVALGC